MSLTPIFLRSFGRTGTTMMMQLLGTADEIAFDRTYPYENRLLTYFYRLSTVPFQKLNGEIKWNNDSIFGTNVNVVGPLPLPTTLIGNTDRFQRDLFKRMWNGISHEVSLENQSAVYYAEKVPHDIPSVLNSVLPCKNLFLLRDPRDEMVSIMEFNAKRGALSFGWTADDTPESFAKKLVKMRKSFMNHFINMEQTERQMKIRYEDVIQDLYKESDRLSEWLNVTLDPAAVVSAQSSHAHHMTSKDPSSSIGRWKDFLSVEVQEIFVEELRDELQAAGYEV